MMKKFRDPKVYNGRERRIQSVETQTAVGTKGLTYAIKVQGNSVPSHSVRIQFNGIEFTDKQPDNFELWIPVRVGSKLMYYKTPHVNEHPVKVWSSSLSYRFEFQKQNYDNKINIGNWKRYKRKTPPKQRPAKPKNPNPEGYDFKNPDNIIGWDITVDSAIKFLIRNKLLRQ